MSEHETADSIGQTGGLPGANAAPAAAELSEDEATTVSGGVAAPSEDSEEQDEDEPAE